MLHEKKQMVSSSLQKEIFGNKCTHSHRCKHTFTWWMLPPHFRDLWLPFEVILLWLLSESYRLWHWCYVTRGICVCISLAWNRQSKPNSSIHPLKVNPWPLILKLCAYPCFLYSFPLSYHPPSSLPCSSVTSPLRVSSRTACPFPIKPLT